MWNHGAVTDIGRTVLAKAAGGKTLVIDGAQSGTGTVAETELRTCTSLAGTTYVLGVTNYEVKEQGVCFTVHITSPGDGYTAKQIGLFGHVDNEESSLLAIYQDETGIAIPDNVQMPDFLYLFYAEIQMNNSGSISITLDPSVLVSQRQLQEAIRNTMPSYINDWLDEHVMQETGYVIDDSLTVPGAAADAKKTGDALDEIKNAVENVKTTLYDVTSLVDYAVRDINYSGKPGASDSTCLGVVRRGSRIVLNGGNIDNASKPNVFVKLTGNTTGRTNNSATVRNWPDGITLKSGRTYKATVIYVSGETSAVSVPATSLSVDNLGESATIGYASRDGYGRYSRYFVATQELNLVLYVPCYQITYTDYTIDVILEEVATEEAQPYIEQRSKEINLYPTQWEKNGLGSDGTNYDRAGSIRTGNYLRVDNILRITVTGQMYLCLYTKTKAFLTRYTYADTTISYSELIKRQPDAVFFRIELLSVNADISASSNVSIIGKNYAYGLDRQDESLQKAKLIGSQRTSAEEYGTCAFRALIVSDVHAEKVRFGNTIALLNHWGATMFDALINCGDTVRALRSHGTDWHDIMLPYIKVPYINVVGNHDAYSSLGVVGDRPTTYQTIIAPIADQEGLVQPAEARTDSLCYYYYDIKNKVRIVALDCMYWDADEAAWLEDTLADAKDKNLYVICVSHYGFLTRYDTPMPSLWRAVSGGAGDGINISAAEKVSAYINGGGTFVCWLVGHSHSDNLYQLSDYNDQMVVTFPSLAQRAGNLLKNSDIDAYNYLCATYMTLDDYQHTVRFLRIGANIDTWGVQHTGLVLDYLNRKLIAAW